MVDSLSNALLLMLIGMITVFVILCIVVFSGGLLIRIINNLHAQQKTTVKLIPSTHVAILTAVSQEVTNGQASEIKIEKI